MKLTGRFRWMPPLRVLTSTPRTPPGRINLQGARSNLNNRGKACHEPDGHAVGRSRDGLSSKLHAAVDGKGMPLAIVLTGGQRHDAKILAEVLVDIRVPRLGPGRPRTKPDAVVADKAYFNGIIRRMLASRGIRAVVPQKSNEQTARKRKGSAGGRPSAFDAHTYADRNVVERHFGLARQWRGIATRYDKLAITYRATAVLCAVVAWVKESAQRRTAKH